MTPMERGSILWMLFTFEAFGLGLLPPWDGVWSNPGPCVAIVIGPPIALVLAVLLRRKALPATAGLVALGTAVAVGAAWLWMGTGAAAVVAGPAVIGACGTLAGAIAAWSLLPDAPPPPARFPRT